MDGVGGWDLVSASVWYLKCKSRETQNFLLACSGTQLG